MQDSPSSLWPPQEDWKELWETLSPSHIHSTDEKTETQQIQSRSLGVGRKNQERAVEGWVRRGTAGRGGGPPVS